MKTITALALLLSALALGCDSAPATKAPPAAPAQEATGLTPEGKTFDPPVKRSAIPDGAWYCDMGTVHYARSEKGDNTCPLCKMKLTEKKAAK